MLLRFQELQNGLTEITLKDFLEFCNSRNIDVEGTKQIEEFLSKGAKLICYRKKYIFTFFLVYEDKFYICNGGRIIKCKGSWDSFRVLNLESMINRLWVIYTNIYDTVFSRYGNIPNIEKRKVYIKLFGQAFTLQIKTLRKIVEEFYICAWDTHLVDVLMSGMMNYNLVHYTNYELKDIIDNDSIMKIRISE